MFLYGVVNASGDSLNTDSIATTPQAATRRAEYLLDHGCQGIDLGGQGSTDNATVVSWEEEWSRLEAIVDALDALGVPLSIDSWKPEVTRRALEHGATVINAADGMQTDEMWQVAADFQVPIVLPFLSGPNPRQMELVRSATAIPLLVKNNNTSIMLLNQSIDGTLIAWNQLVTNHLPDNIALLVFTRNDNGYNLSFSVLGSVDWCWKSDLFCFLSLFGR